MGFALVMRIAIEMALELKSAPARLWALESLEAVSGSEWESEPQFAELWCLSKW